MHWLDDGDVQTLANGSRFHYPLELVDGTIGTRTVRCFSPEVDVLLHWGYPPGATDHSDMAALRDATGVSLPHPFTKGLTHVLARDAQQRFYVRRGWTPDGTEHRFELVGREIVTLHYRIDL